MTEYGLSIGIPPEILKSELEQHVVDYVYEKIALWRDNEENATTATENVLSEHLCDFLDNSARLDEVPVRFSHQTGQGQKHHVDFSAKPISTCMIAFGYASIHDTVLVFEAKRLPAPDKKREFEYLSGCSIKKAPSGGVQRFKLGLHGYRNNMAVLVGYIQQQNAAFFFSCINKWLNDFANKSPDSLSWTKSEQLQHLEYDTSRKKARSTSQHPRTQGDNIVLHHLWIEM